MPITVHVSFIINTAASNYDVAFLALSVFIAEAQNL